MKTLLTLAETDNQKLPIFILAMAIFLAVSVGTRQLAKWLERKGHKSRQTTGWNYRRLALTLRVVFWVSVPVTALALFIGCYWLDSLVSFFVWFAIECGLWIAIDCKAIPDN